MAQPEIQHLAKLMLDAMSSSIPTVLNHTEWHLPYVFQEELDYLDMQTMIKISVARCARVSYLTQEGATPSVEKDLELYERLVGSEPLHASPCEHQATPTLTSGVQSGNFTGWVQYRKILEAKSNLTYEGYL